MSWPVYPATASPVIGDNDPIYGNTWDSANMQIQASLEVKHTEDGEHRIVESSSSGILRILGGSYTGNGLSSQTITLISADFKILYVEIITSGVAYLPMVSASMSAGYAKIGNNTFTTGYISSIGTGSFVVGSSLNTSAQIYYYRVFGIYSVLPTGNGNTFTPSWIEHGDSIILDANSDGPSTAVSKEIATRFLAEHNSDGSHKKHGQGISIGTLTGTGLEQTITVSALPTLSMVLYWENSSQYPVLKLASMPGAYSKRYNGYYHYTNILRSLSQNTFVVNTANGVTGYYMAVGS